jgi:hypothetical protein
LLLNWSIGGIDVKKVLSFVAAAIMVGIATAPVQAADKGGNEVTDMAKSAAWFPVQVAGVTAAWVVGTPIAITRQAAVRIREYNSGAADKIGGHEHFPPNLFASVFAVPAGSLVGLGEGVYLGAKNAIGHGVEKPFSLDSFSLGDDVEQ